MKYLHTLDPREVADLTRPADYIEDEPQTTCPTLDSLLDLVTPFGLTMPTNNVKFFAVQVYKM